MHVNTRIAFDGGSLVSYQNAAQFAPELCVEAGWPDMFQKQKPLK